ncbi:MAG: response regulator transcription factor [Saprospiraceae bacterium]|jgi:DNA-binding response OmpR family regulator|nr:response regulator transcription factor [Saprospiraceae bacterium]
MSSKVKVLYVEDEPFLAKIVKESLESRLYEVNLITDGLHVIPAFEQYQPDICILDVMLPNIDGFTLGEKIRKKQLDVPIIYLTAKNQTDDVIKGFTVGGNDYLKKPFSMEELIIRMQNLLQLMQGNVIKPTTKSFDKFQLGHYHFYPLRYELAYKEEITKLSHREAQVLQLLVGRKNQSVARKKILKEVWGDDTFFNSRNLDVYIKKLRDYLKKDESVKIITLKGVGYRFVVD